MKDGKYLRHTYQPSHIHWRQDVGMLNSSSESNCGPPKAIFLVIQCSVPAATTEETATSLHDNFFFGSSVADSARRLGPEY